MLALHHLALRICLAGLDHFVVGGEEFKAMLLRPVTHFSHPDIFQGDDTTGLLVCGELEVIQAIIVENKPASFPAFVASSLFP